MATYRPFHVGFWTDPDIEPFKPEEKLVYAFLFTNPMTTESGVYSISEKFIAERTGINCNKIKKSNNHPNDNIDKKRSGIFKYWVLHNFMKNNLLKNLLF